MLHKASLLLFAMLAAGCASLPERREQRAPTAAAPSTEMLQAVQVVRQMLDMQTAVRGSPTEQAEVMKSARDGYEDAKRGPAALRYGLMLAAPGNPARDVVLAKRVLTETLARPELLSSGEHALAVVELARVDTELALVTERDRLIAELQQERERQRVAPTNTASSKALQAEKEETARLRKLLDEARAKLDAITRIERSFSDRPTPAEPRTQ
jgi:hypothetical protein